MDTERNMMLPYLPYGRFLHVPPVEPTADWSTDFGGPWWLNKDLIIGALTKKTRKVRIINTLTKQTDVLVVASEESIAEIRDRYMEFNKHATSYTWKRAGDNSNS